MIWYNRVRWGTRIVMLSGLAFTLTVGYMLVSRSPPTDVPPALPRQVVAMPRAPDYDCPVGVRAAFPPRPDPGRAASMKSGEGEDRWLLRHFFAGMRGSNYTFVEIGALDGVSWSNTYYFERVLGWRGVLIEASTPNYARLERMRAGPLVSLIHAGVCARPRILHIFGEGPVADQRPEGGRHRSSALCLPMAMLLDLAEIKMDHVDLYSIDVEGAELDVVLTHNFIDVPAFLVLVEMRVVDEERSNVYVRRALADRGFCRFATNVGHANEVWISPAHKPT